MIKQHILKIVYAIIGITLLMLLYVAFLLLRPVHPFDIHSVKILTPTIRTNGVLMYRFDYCSHSKTLPIVYRQFVPEDGGSVVPFASVLSIAKPGCHVTDIPLPVLPGTPPGHYRLKGLLVYQINSFRSVSLSYITDVFEVTK